MPLAKSNLVNVLFPEQMRSVLIYTSPKQVLIFTDLYLSSNKMKFKNSDIDIKFQMSFSFIEATEADTALILDLDETHGSASTLAGVVNQEICLGGTGR